MFTSVQINKFQTERQRATNAIYAVGAVITLQAIQVLLSGVVFMKASNGSRMESMWSNYQALELVELLMTFGCAVFFLMWYGC